MSHAYLTIIVLIVICCTLANVEAASKRVNGGWSRWSRWGRCSKTCAAGVQIRRRTCTNPRPSGGGRRCRGTSLQRRICACKQVNGGWSGYGHWSSCSKNCGGTRTRTRSCRNPRPSCCGAKCRGSSRQTRSCNTPRCKLRVNGGWSRWGRWGRCSKTCAGGVKIRRRFCTNPRPSGGGRRCPGTSLQRRSCPCKQVNGRWSGYGRWSPCSKNSGGGIRTRTRSCTKPRPSCCGAKCRGSSRQTRSCNTQSYNTSAAFAKSIMKANSTNTRRCNARPTTCPARHVCPKTCVNFCYYHARDFLIILDSSGSITVPEYEEAKVDLAIIATHLCGHIGCDLRVAGMHFSTNTHFAFGFDEHTSSPALYSAIIGMGKEHRGTNTHLAFNFARLTMFTIANGHRPCAKKVALIVTDGKSANGHAAISAAQNLKKSGVELFGVYIGNPGDHDYAEIRAYVSYPKWLHVFSVRPREDCFCRFATGIWNDCLESHSIDVMAKKFARAVMANSVIRREIICRTRRCNAPPGSTCEPQPPVCTLQCTYGDRDFLFIIDSSGSIEEPDYNTAQVNLAVIAIHLCGNLGPTTHVVAMQFSRDAQKEFAFDEYVDTIPLFDGILAMPWLNKNTRTWLAFYFAKCVMFTAANGHRPWVKKQALIVTDGKSNGAPPAGQSARVLSIAAAQVLKLSGVELFALWIGDPDDDDLDEIRHYVSLPVEDHVFSVDSVMQLEQFVVEISLIHERICAC